MESCEMRAIGYMKGAIPGTDAHLMEAGHEHALRYGGYDTPDTPVCWCGATYRRIKAHMNATRVGWGRTDILLYTRDDKPERHRAAWAKVLGIDIERLAFVHRRGAAYDLLLDAEKFEATFDQAWAVHVLLEPDAAKLVPPFYDPEP